MSFKCIDSNQPYVYKYSRNTAQSVNPTINLAGSAWGLSKLVPAEPITIDGCMYLLGRYSTLRESTFYCVPVKCK